MNDNLENKVALVTGASRGIGFATAVELAKNGAHVIALARTVGGLEELDDEIQKVGGNATLIPHDLMDLDGIDNIGSALQERFGKLDILVANAAMLGPITPIGHIDAKIFEKVMHLNVTATWRLIRSIEPLLAKSDSGRAAIISSGVAHSCKPFWGAYSTSKAAVEALARVWAAEVEKRGICVNSVNPGATRTAMRAQAMPGENADTLPLAEEVAAKIVPIFAPGVTVTGKLFDVRKEKFLNYQLPS
ncbi:SDR family NAD(P)-dependent oxidoreductase [Lentilitoribacter sp. Alg239-R112]|uniref:SDR family NAD(P)-dependent oxidoreductase n=1 Tax=Lentilitoribacter sp. Alg239-R112 TaxID=2305987 RepID=UPI0013A6E600|nr:SDR family NAD(P)-dependent oxidoreductase [Lentilitoribacter sp. Alg239-R112]